MPNGQNNAVNRPQFLDEFEELVTLPEDIVNDEDFDTEEHQRDANMATSKYCSEDEGEIIKSTRKFGVELEVNLGTSGQAKLAPLLAKEFGLVHDGSVNNGIEVVSPILQGSKGEEQIVATCKALKKVGADADESTGMHVHLDAPDFFCKPQVRVLTLRQALKVCGDKAYTGYNFTIIHQNTLKELKPYYRGELYSQLTSFGEIDVFHWSAWDNFTQSSGAMSYLKVYFSGSIKATKENFFMAIAAGARGLKLEVNNEIDTDTKLKEYTGAPVLTGNWGAFAVVDPEYSKDDIVLAVKRSSVKNVQNAVERLKRLAAVYTVFDDVIASTLPLERRENDYTRRLNLQLSLTDINNVQTLLDFFILWTKTFSLSAFRQSLNEARHESRYHGINFHSLLKHGTVEIRYHSGTIEANKVLYWTALHQRIVDLTSELDNQRFSIERLEKANMVVNIEQKANLFFKKLGLNAATEKYFRARIKEFGAEDENLVASLLEDDTE